MKVTLWLITKYTNEAKVVLVFSRLFATRDDSYSNLMMGITFWIPFDQGRNWGQEEKQGSNNYWYHCLSYSITFPRCHCPYKWGVQWGGGPSATTWCELQWIRVHFAQLCAQHHAPVPLWKVWRCWCSMPRFVGVQECGCVSVHIVVYCCECVYVYEIYNVHVYTMFYH